MARPMMVSEFVDALAQCAPGGQVVYLRQARHAQVLGADLIRCAAWQAYQAGLVALVQRRDPESRLFDYIAVRSRAPLSVAALEGIRGGVV